MDMRWSGPLRVVKQLGVETYRVQDVRRPRRRLVVHSDRLKSYHNGTHQDATTGGSEPPGGYDPTRMDPKHRRTSRDRPQNRTDHSGCGDRPDALTIICGTTNVGGLGTDLPRGTGSVTT
ncbi:hypothetical protein T03_16335 [Trichinella britovi]|uniref:Integrase p58-like C-terminal domain-containing protein n=1 Tax=Trichinella britovi TaxID=45882 RepID=A0A0V1ANE9_TRIBR|nr:hypothetical protein T03_16335 [Trichinella britovi]